MPPAMKLLTRDLPAPAADPLHILPPFMPLLLGLAGAALLVSVGIWLLMYYFSTRQAMTPRVRQHSRTADNVAAQIRAIQKRTNGTGEFREGCHELSFLLKSHFEQSTGLQVEEMTPGEIARTLKGPLVGFFGELSRLQFGRPEPEKTDFDRACRLAENARKSKATVLRHQSP